MILLCVAALASFAWAGQWNREEVTLLPTDVQLGRSPVDQEELDTLYYDDDGNQNLYFSTLTNYYVYVRFTPPANFQLHSIYFAAGYGGTGSTACSLFVHLPGTNNRPGTLLGQALQTVDQTAWFDVTLNDTIDFTAGQDFMIVLGRSPGPTGWYPFLDPVTTVNRSYYTTGSRMTGTYTVLGYDFRIRAGGTMATFVDLAATECFNDVGANTPAFNMLAGTQQTLKAIVHNPSSDPVTDYSVIWDVYPAGSNTPIFTNEAVGQAVNPDQDRTVTATEALTVNTEGEYIVRCLVDATDDANALNDTTWLRFFVGPAPKWFRYDDNGDPEGTVSYGAGNGKGVSFKAINFPADIESVRVAVSQATTGDVRIYMNNAQGMPTGQPLWNETPALAAGWNSVAVDPPFPVFAGQSFTVGYFFTGTEGLGKDANAPNCAGITNMGTIAWDTDGSSWTAETIGNWAIQAYIDTANVPAPFPVIATNLDTLQFGQVDTTGNHSVTLTLWIYNQGGSQALAVSNMQINPAGQVRNAYHLSRTSIPSIAAGDSASVDVTFNPSTVGNLNGLLVITNNSLNAPTKNVLVRGQGVAGSSADNPHSGMPVQFELSQNFPNPFNPTTDISFALPQASDVRLGVYNMLGQQVAVLAQGTFEAGWHTVNFDAANLPAGLYFYRIEANDFTAIKKMMLLK
jgi:hypothetical protein